MSNLVMATPQSLPNVPRTDKAPLSPEQVDSLLRSYLGKTVVNMERGLKRIRSAMREQGVLSSYRDGELHTPGSTIVLYVVGDIVVERPGTGEIPDTVIHERPFVPGKQALKAVKPSPATAMVSKTPIFETFPDDKAFAEQILNYLVTAGFYEKEPTSGEHEFWFTWPISILRHEIKSRFNHEPDLAKRAVFFITMRARELRIAVPRAIVLSPKASYTVGDQILIGIGPIIQP